jgi:hypothetical protein
MTYKFDEDNVLTWPVQAYGKEIRGDSTTSEDQIGSGMMEEIAERMAAC